LFPKHSGIQRKNAPPPPSKDAALVVTGHLVDQVPVTSLTAEYISTPLGDYPRDETRELVRSNGGRLFLVNASLPARIEADQVRGLRRNALLNGLFHTAPSGPDANRIPLPFWILVGGLVLALMVVGAFHK
jgi:hypothetical protein